MSIVRNLLSTEEAARFLGCHPVSLRRQRTEGIRKGYMPLVPYIRFGRSIKYQLSDLEAYIADHRVLPNDEPRS